MATIFTLAAAAFTGALCVHAAKRWQDAQAKMSRLRIARMRERHTRYR